MGVTSLALDTVGQIKGHSWPFASEDSSAGLCVDCAVGVAVLVLTISVTFHCNSSFVNGTLLAKSRAIIGTCTAL